jgi:hypothetical protein
MAFRADSTVCSLVQQDIQRRLEYHDVTTTDQLRLLNSHVQAASQGVAFHRDSASAMTGETNFTVGAYSTADVVTITLGTIVVTHEEKPRFVPVRAKYDTGSDVNLVPIALVEKNGLSDFLVKLDEDGSEDNVFLGINNQEYVIHHTITLKWSAATMHNIRTTYFHVAEDLPYDMVLGNPFVQDNQIFHPHRGSGKSRHYENTPATSLTQVQPRKQRKRNCKKLTISRPPRSNNKNGKKMRRSATLKERRRDLPNCRHQHQLRRR